MLGAIKVSKPLNSSAHTISGAGSSHLGWTMDNRHTSDRVHNRDLDVASDCA